MGEVFLTERDKLVLRLNHKTGRWEAKEIVIHDKETAILLKRGFSILGDLQKGQTPRIETPDPGIRRYVCLEGCGSTAPAFPEMSDQTRMYCQKCGLWTFWKKEAIR